MEDINRIELLLKSGELGPSLFDRTYNNIINK